MNRTLLIYWLLSLVSLQLHSQLSSKMSREEYIDTYKELAIREMYRSGIPASITLAQGMLESDNGNSRLAVKANNHFGIKCHSDWKGKRVHHDDDARNECFRKYNSVYESYVDHSDFLMNGSRYDFLFELERTDYKGWARGLKKAGYATSRSYADHLIRIIEENNLHQYDLMDNFAPDAKDGIEYAGERSYRKIYMNNRIDYIIAREGDSFESLKDELKLFKNELFRYNELGPDSTITDGQILYLQPKRSRAEAGKKVHILKENESLYDISQKYGVKLKKLLERNGLEPGDNPVPGTKIYLRGTNPEKSKAEEEVPHEEEEVEFEIEF